MQIICTLIVPKLPLLNNLYPFPKKTLTKRRSFLCSDVFWLQVAIIFEMKSERSNRHSDAHGYWLQRQEKWDLRPAIDELLEAVELHEIVVARAARIAIPKDCFNKQLDRFKKVYDRAVTQL